MGTIAFTKPRQLTSEDILDGFVSGVPLVDRWFATHAAKARKLGTAVVYLTYAESTLAGFYTLSSQSISRERASGWIARNTPEEIPVILLGMMGVDQRFQGMGLGKDLLLDAAHRASMVASEIGARALVLDPVDDAAESFYAKFGFRHIPNQNRMYAKLPANSYAGD